MSLSELLYTLGRLAGIIGFICLSLLIFSGDTARFFDKYFGLDKIIKFQRKFSLITAFFIGFHPIFFILSSGSISYYLVPNFAIIPLALGISAFYIFVVIMIASKLYKRISYTWWQYIHILIYILFFFALYHASNWGSDRNLLYIKLLYGILLTAVSIGIIYRTQYKIRKKFSGTFSVHEVTQNTKDTYTVSVTPEKKFHFKAGQFCFLRLNKNRLYSRHPFTISSAPQNNDLQFTIKKAGRFTQTAFNLKPGENILIDGPFGNFILKDNKKDLVFIAGGVGITPFMSLIRDHVNKKSSQNILLLYASRTEKDIIFKEELNQIKEKWFEKVYLLSEEKPCPESCISGYIDRRIIEKYTKNKNQSLFYICGPEAMKKHIVKVLSDLGVRNKDIIIEDFFW